MNLFRVVKNGLGEFRAEWSENSGLSWKLAWPNHPNDGWTKCIEQARRTADDRRQQLINAKARQQVVEVVETLEPLVD